MFFVCLQQQKYESTAHSVDGQVCGDSKNKKKYIYSDKYNYKFLARRKNANGASELITCLRGESPYHTSLRKKTKEIPRSHAHTSFIIKSNVYREYSSRYFIGEDGGRRGYSRTA
eukprot:GEMP01108451.1.p1 GENE.GEMP01108451.1~~GEMP01108451.1.p1  ORF type:complete len:115 (-),score=2.51 GEMP01108451.1:320-664(-)